MVVGAGKWNGRRRRGEEGRMVAAARVVVKEIREH